MSETPAAPSRLLALLRACDLFQDLADAEMDALLIHMRMIRTQKGFQIIRQGDSWDSFYVILSGRVSVKAQKGSRTLRMGNLGKGEFFGEMALLTRQPRNATVTSLEVSELMVLRKREFDELLMKHPARAQKIRRAFLERASRNHQAPA
jgi:CRP-like cAMP-binding protein